MENQKTAEQNLDELSQDPQALENALQNELDAADNQGADQKPAGESEAEAGEGDGKKKTTADRFADILSDRNEARKKAEAAETEKNALANKVAELETTINTLKKVSEDKGAGDGSDVTAKENKQLTQDDIMALVNNKVSEILSSKEQSVLAEKSTADEINATAEKPDFAGMKGREGEVRSIMNNHPTLTAAAAYLLLVGIENGQRHEGSNADKLGVGARSNSDLLRDKKPADMTTAELETEVNRLANSGQLTL